MEAPVLETERLTLRAHRIDDFPQCAALWADPVVTQFIGGSPDLAEDAWNRILRYAGHWALLGFGYWVAEERETGRLLGEVGFADYHRALDPPFGNTPEAGWVFAPAAHGKGFATEALHAIHDWGKGHFQTAQSACFIHPDNTASLRLASKFGYQETARSSYRGRPAIVLHRDW